MTSGEQYNNTNVFIHKRTTEQHQSCVQLPESNTA